MSVSRENIHHISGTKEMGVFDKVHIARPVGVDLFYGDFKEAEERRSLYGDIRNLFKRIPDPAMDIGSALENHLIDPDNLAEVYQNITNFLNTDPDNSRLVLYFPFEFLPNLKSSTPVSHELETAQRSFIEAYCDSWLRLLFESDTRANFVDGDNLEPGLGTLSRVRKAAHFLPELYKRGIVTPDFVEEIKSINSDDQELISSLNEGEEAVSCFSVETPIQKRFDLTEFQRKLNIIDEKYNLDSPIVSRKSIKDKYENSEVDTKISHERADWLRKVEREELLNETACLLNDENLIESVFLVDSPDTAYKLLALKAIFSRNYLSDTSDHLIRTAWKSDSLDLKNSVIIGLNHWFRDGLLSKDYLDEFDIQIPDLSLPFPVELDKLRSTDLKELADVAVKINSDPILSKHLYPVFIIFGSRVKGYAGLNSDMDLAIIFRPDTDWEDREILLQSLRTIPELNNVGKISELWTTEVNGEIDFKPTPDLFTTLKPHQIHVFLNGIWLGVSPDNQKIKQNISKKYLYPDNSIKKMRYGLLRQIESDILQCRLLHKGYHKYYPDNTDPKIKKSTSIDGKSAFWDPGYRRVATQLFLSRVFLPNLT